MAIATEVKPADYRTDIHPDWCPGCGDFGILNAIRQALAELNIQPHDVLTVSGIGCSGKTPHYIKSYGLHTLHGRSLPVATGAKLANGELTVLAMGGDGDGYGIGAGHFVNAGRRNLDMTYIVFNNGVYGLTKGQSSPTLRRGDKTKSMKEPSIQDNINPIAIAIAAGYTFVARGYAMDVKSMKDILIRAIQHRGTAIIDVLQPCPVYNDLQTAEFYAGRDLATAIPRVYKLEEEGFDPRVHDPEDGDEIIAKKVAATARSFEWGDRIPIGLFYQVDLPTLGDGFAAYRPDAPTTAMHKQAHPGQDVTRVLGRFR